jgi:hypothetical protein
MEMVKKKEKKIENKIKNIFFNFRFYDILNLKIKFFLIFLKKKKGKSHERRL